MKTVTMVDNFMSGWGEADGKTNIYAVECDTLEQAEQIVKAAKKRDEMTKIKMLDHTPKSDKRRLVTVKQFHQLGSIWTGE